MRRASARRHRSCQRADAASVSTLGERRTQLIGGTLPSFPAASASPCHAQRVKKIERPAGWERFVSKHERALLLVDLVLVFATAVIGLLALSAGDRVGWIFLLVALAGVTGMGSTRLLARRVRQDDARGRRFG